MLIPSAPVRIFTEWSGSGTRDLIRRKTSGLGEALDANGRSNYRAPGRGGIKETRSGFPWNKFSYRTTLAILPDRRQRVQTRIRLEPPEVAARTERRFGLNWRFETLWA